VSRRLIELILVSTLLVLIAVPSASQTPSLPGGVAGLEQLSAKAGIIFSGTVLRVARESTNDSNPSTVLISFRVDEAGRGCVSGETIVVREWAELWERNDRYRPGQRVLLFLYPPSEAGLTSPVNGDLGKIEIGPQGLLRFTPQQAHFLASQSNASSQPGGRPTHGESDTQSTRARLRNIPSNKLQRPAEAAE
jgi:hypothetical protein